MVLIFSIPTLKIQFSKLSTTLPSQSYVNIKIWNLFLNFMPNNEIERVSCLLTTTQQHKNQTKKKKEKKLKQKKGKKYLRTMIFFLNSGTRIRLYLKPMKNRGWDMMSFTRYDNHYTWTLYNFPCSKSWKTVRIVSKLLWDRKQRRWCEMTRKSYVALNTDFPCPFYQFYKLVPQFAKTAVRCTTSIFWLSNLS